MKTAVIYARYSSDKQNEQSIEGQLHVCEKYAKEHDITKTEKQSANSPRTAFYSYASSYILWSGAPKRRYALQKACRCFLHPGRREPRAA